MAVSGGGETASHPSAWNVDTLKAHFEQRFTDNEKAVNAALAAAALAVDRAETNAEKWRANANEWRAAMTDRETKFMAQETAEAHFKDIERRLADLSKSRDTTAGGKSDRTQMIAWGVSLISLGIAAISLITR